MNKTLIVSNNFLWFPTVKEELNGSNRSFYVGALPKEVVTGLSSKNYKKYISYIKSKGILEVSREIPDSVKKEIIDNKFYNSVHKAFLLKTNLDNAICSWDSLDIFPDNEFFDKYIVDFVLLNETQIFNQLSKLIPIIMKYNKTIYFLCSNDREIENLKTFLDALITVDKSNCIDELLFNFGENHIDGYIIKNLSFFTFKRTKIFIVNQFSPDLDKEPRAYDIINTFENLITTKLNEPSDIDTVKESLAPTDIDELFFEFLQYKYLFFKNMMSIFHDKYRLYLNNSEKTESDIIIEFDIRDYNNPIKYYVKKSSKLTRLFVNNKINHIYYPIIYSLFKQKDELVNINKLRRHAYVYEHLMNKAKENGHLKKELGKSNKDKTKDLLSKNIVAINEQYTKSIEEYSNKYVFPEKLISEEIINGEKLFKVGDAANSILFIPADAREEAIHRYYQQDLASKEEHENYSLLVSYLQNEQVMARIRGRYNSIVKWVANPISLEQVIPLIEEKAMQLFEENINVDLLFKNLLALMPEFYKQVRKEQGYSTLKKSDENINDVSIEEDKYISEEDLERLKIFADAIIYKYYKKFDFVEEVESFIESALEEKYKNIT